MDQVRLQKFLADAGLASRRSAESLILAGRVAVNGALIQQLGTKVHPTRDTVTVDGRTVRPKRRLYIALHKPRGYLCSRKSEGQQKLVGALLPREWTHLYTIGRLDAASEGLILLTNDGDFAQHVAHPRYSIEKRYEVLVTGRVAPSLLPTLTQGVTDHGEQLRAVRAKLLSANNTRSCLELTLSEGKNREIRRLLAALNLQVQRLVRVQIGPVRLAELPVGKWRTLTESEIKSLLLPL